jgi:ABC-type transport system involved in multi-copper enzyme maturation permease subunit
VLAIALNTYRESLRSLVLLILAGAAFATSIFSIFVGTFTLRNAPRVVSDVGVASISVFGILVAIVISATSLYRELELKTIFPILARPIRRGEYLAGKYLGTVLTLAVFVMADAGLLLFINAVFGGRPVGLVAGGAAALVLVLLLGMGRSTWARTYGPIPWALLVLLMGVGLSTVLPDERRVVLGGSALALMEMSIIAAFGVLFSSFSTPLLSAFLTVGVIVVGRNADLLAHISVKSFGAALHEGGLLLSRVVPNLHVYVPPRPLLSGEAVGEPLGSYLAMAGAAAMAWVVGLLAVASFIFRKRDFL